MSVVFATNCKDSEEPITEEKCEKRDVVGFNNKFYELGDLLAEGGFGAIYRAKETVEDDYRYALKVIESGPPRLSLHILKLRNPHIIHIYAFGAFTSSDGTVGVAALMELAEGRSLNEHIGDGLRLRLIAKYGKHLLSALEYLHHQGLYHADVKPSNILLKNRFNVTGEYRVAKLGDLDNLLSGTESKVVHITRKYRPKWDTRTVADMQAADMWAFGCVLFEMAFGAGKMIAEPLQLFVRPPNERSASWVQMVQKWIDNEGQVNLHAIDHYKPVCPLFHSMLRQCLCDNRVEFSTARHMLEHPFFRECDVFYPPDVQIAEGLAQRELLTRKCKHCCGEFLYNEVERLTVQVCGYAECSQPAANKTTSASNVSAGSSKASSTYRRIHVLPVYEYIEGGRKKQHSSLVHALEPHLHHSSQLELLSFCPHVPMVLLLLEGFAYRRVSVTRPAATTEAISALVGTLGAIGSLQIEWPDFTVVPVLQFPSDPFQIDEVVMAVATGYHYYGLSAVRGNYIKHIRFDLGGPYSPALDLDLCGSAMAHLEDLIIGGGDVKARPRFLPSQRFPNLRSLALNSCNLDCDCTHTDNHQDYGACGSAVQHLTLKHVNGTVTQQFLQQMPKLTELRLEWRKSSRIFVLAFETGSRIALRLLTRIEFVPYDKFRVRFTRLFHLANVLCTFEVMDGVKVVSIDQLVGAMFNLDLPEDREIVEGRFKDHYRIISDAELTRIFTQGLVYINQLYESNEADDNW